jgi:2-iminobutanoate/2-iminopropanoate deaminase
MHGQESAPRSVVPQVESHQPVSKKAISAPSVLNETDHYFRPSSFSRGLRLDIRGVTIIVISGNASVDEKGLTVQPGTSGPRRGGLSRTSRPCWRRKALGNDMVRTTCHLRDIERDYSAFSEIRTQFCSEQRLDPLPASTGIQAILCRPDLLIEIEALAIFESQAHAGKVD